MLSRQMPVLRFPEVIFINLNNPSPLLSSPCESMKIVLYFSLNLGNPFRKNPLNGYKFKRNEAFYGSKRLLPKAKPRS